MIVIFIPSIDLWDDGLSTIGWNVYFVWLREGIEEGRDEGPEKIALSNDSTSVGEEESVSTAAASSYFIASIGAE